MHERLAAYSHKRHIKSFDKALRAIDKELDSVQAAERSVVIQSYNEHKRAIRRFFEGIKKDDIDQIMAIETNVGSYPVLIEMSMINTGWWLPLTLCIILPVAIPGAFQCNRSMFGRKWTGASNTYSLSQQIDRILPKILMNHQWQALLVKVNTCYSFEPHKDDTTLWTTQIGFKSGMLNQPRIRLGSVIQCAESLESVFRASHQNT